MAQWATSNLVVATEELSNYGQIEMTHPSDRVIVHDMNVYEHEYVRNDGL